jgi:hypothetical protein
MESTLNKICIGPDIQGYVKKIEAFKGVDVLDENGEWTGEVIETPGTRRQVGWEKKNQVLDAGREIMATSTNWAGQGSKAQVGTDDTEPVAGDTQLGGYVAGTAVIHNHDFGAQGSAPYYGWDLTTYRFAQGDAEAVLSEAGVGWSVSDGPFLITRVLIVDSFGAPTDAVVLGDEYLDLVYELRYYPPLTDVLGTQTFDGVVYDTIARAALVTSWGDNIGETLGQRSESISDWSAFDGDIGTIVQGPSGIRVSCDNKNQFNLGYQSNSYEIDMQCDCGIGTGVGDAWNLALGIRSIRIRMNGGWFQIQFNAQGTGARIPKNVSKQIVAWIFRLGWTAEAIP